MTDQYDDYAQMAGEPSGSDVAGLKVLPHNVDVERALLGSLFIDNSVIDAVQAAGVGEQVFYNSKHRQIYRAAMLAYERHGSLDVVVCGEELELAGSSLLADLVAIVRGTPSAANYKSYIKVVSDHAVRRRWIAACNEVQSLMFDASRMLESERLAKAETILTKLDAVGGVDSRVGLDDAMKQVLDYLDEKYNNPGMLGVSTGFKHVDHRLGGLEGGQLIVVGARPSMGKTTYGMHLVLQAAKQGKVALVYSMEMKAKKLTARLLANEGKIEMGFMTNPKQLEQNGYEQGWTKLSAAMQTLKGLPIVFDEQAGMTVAEIRARALQENRRGRLGLVMVDYLQLVDGDQSQSSNDRIGFASRTLKKLAMELDCPVVALSQLNRKLEERRNKRPQMADLRDSGAIEQDADVIQFLYRDEVYNENSDYAGRLEVITAKCRDGESGTDYVEWLGRYNRIDDMPDGFRGAGRGADDDDLV